VCLKEQPNLVLVTRQAQCAETAAPDVVAQVGKQAIDDDASQTGGMLAALLGWGQATCASKVEKSSDSELTVTREVRHATQLSYAALSLSCVWWSVTRCAAAGGQRSRDYQGDAAATLTAQTPHLL
jgi:electron transfer flavoprotein alpha/beta subunit